MPEYLGKDFGLAYVTQDSSGSVLTQASGWSLLDSGDQNNPDSQSNDISYRWLDGTEGATETWTTSNTSFVTISIGSFYGRDSTLTPTVVKTQDTTGSNVWPRTLSLGTATIADGDDVVIVVGMDSTVSGDPIVFYDASHNFQIRAQSVNGFCMSCFCTLDNRIGGPISPTIKVRGGTATAGFTSWIIVIKAAPIIVDPPYLQETMISYSESFGPAGLYSGTAWF